ncbi:MAG: hypothetical protein IGBAC_0032 [Ignavibacteriae bacterium]|nr:MAG: hypothetical protein IGBAC_0032 [Ignavibacteriota bacterium]
MKNLFNYLESNGIILVKHNSKYPILSLEQVILDHLKYQLPKNEVNLFIKKFLEEMYKNKYGIEHNGLGNLRCILSRNMFASLYSLKIQKTQNNKPLKKLPKNLYSKFEIEVYDFISKQKITPQKYLQYFFQTQTSKSRKELEKILKRLQRDFCIVKVGQDKKLGQLWKIACKYDGRLTKKILKLSRKEAIKNIVFYIIKSSNGISRPQIKKLLKNIATGDEIDLVVTSLILNNQVEFHKTLVVNGKKALIAQQK